MYEVNGIDLSTSEFEELKLLSEYEGDVAKFANSRLRNIDTNVFNSDLVYIHKELNRVGLIDGYGVWTGFVFEGLTLAGRTFVKEYDKQQEERRQKQRSERAFQIRLNVLTFILSILASVITSFLVSRFLS